jgi:hypothetical protein
MADNVIIKSMNHKKYWLIVGLVFFVICFILSSYYSFIANQNTIQVYRTGVDAVSINFVGLLNFIPGFNFLIFFAYAGPHAMYLGSFMLSVLYGLAGMIIGGIYGRIKNRKVSAGPML